MVLCTIFLSFLPIYCGFIGQVYDVVKILKLFAAVLLLVLSIINKPIKQQRISIIAHIRLLA